MGGSGLRTTLFALLLFLVIGGSLLRLNTIEADVKADQARRDSILVLLQADVRLVHARQDTVIMLLRKHICHEGVPCP